MKSLLIILFTIMNIYDFTVLDTKKNEVKLDEYKGKVLLVVNTATGCGFTPQYEALENLYKKYQDKGLVILDFPCNQFGQQAPGTDEEIVSFCQLKYKVSLRTKRSFLSANSNTKYPSRSSRKSRSTERTRVRSSHTSRRMVRRRNTKA